MCKVFKEKKTGNIIICCDEKKLVFSGNVYRGYFRKHVSDINKKQYQVEYEKGFYSFFLKKELILKISSGKFDKPINI